jgi:lysozyme
VALAGVALAGAGGWAAIGSYRPALSAGERYGVDVSHHQGLVDWEAVAADDMTFAYVKATEGGDMVDPRFAENWEGAGRAGLDRGAYHFFTLCRPGREQAANLVRTLGDRSGELPPAIDLELAGNCSSQPDRAWIDREVGAFLDGVEAATGQVVVLYVGADFEQRYPGITAALGRPVWARRFPMRPDVEGWWIWQLHGYAHIDGIDGRADLNIMRGTRPPA